MVNDSKTANSRLGCLVCCQKEWVATFMAGINQSRKYKKGLIKSKIIFCRLLLTTLAN